MGRCHGRATQTLVPVSGCGGEDAASRRRHVNGGAAVAREVRQLAGPGSGGDRDDVADVIIGRVVRSMIVVGSGVTSCYYEEHASSVSTFNGRAQRRAGLPTTPRVAGNLGPIGQGILDGPDGVRCTPPSRGVQELQRHQAHPMPSDACHSKRVVPAGSYSASTVRTMHVVIHGVAAVADEVEPMDVVDVAVPVVIDAIARDLPRIHPHLLP
mmetsp:Transcript_111589/g.280731  ORF Transcript_111589/g.280731 Transcript_111589/m.280731 type:complete len:212 (-) Transcript_111589:592-1227(-)